MKSFSHFLIAVVALVVVSSCSNMNKNLQQMIPSDATGVVSIDVPLILEQAGVKHDDEIELPESLMAIVDENDDNLLCQLFTDLPYMGVDTDSHCYVFFTSKSFSQVVLVPLDDERKAMDVMSRRVGGDFAAHEGLQCAYVEDHFYAVKDHVLMIARVSRLAPIEKLAHQAAIMYSRNGRDITAVEEVMAHINGEGAVNIYLTMPAVKSLLNGSVTYRELAEKMPLVDIFTESDIKAVLARVMLDDKGGKLEAELLADEGSDYVRLLKATTSKPSASVLAAIPNSMEYIMSMSVHGDKFVALPQIQQLLDVFKALPYIGVIDLAAILRNIDGPFAVGMAHDPTFDDEWNAVVAAKTTHADAIVSQISAFATAMGQAPEIYDGEYIYQYDNKMIKVGTSNDVLYVKMLNYEQTEGYASELPAAVQLFDSAPIAFYVQPSSPFSGAHFSCGLTDYVHVNGEFVPSSAQTNATLELLEILCSVKSSHPYDDMASDAWASVSGLPASNH